MTCRELSERMPVVAGGRDAWTAAEADHVRNCADCRAEWAVVGAGAGMFGSVSLDANALAGRVLTRLRTEPIVDRPSRAWWLVGLAAAAVIAVIVIPNNAPAPRPRGPAAQPFTLDVPGLDALGADGLADVLESLDTPWTATSTTDAPTLDDLDAQELERVERSWEI